MRVFIGMILLLGAVASGAWAYLQNHRANMAADHIAQLEHDIDKLERDIAVYQIEWANLNRPSRLRALVDAHFETLQLVEMTAFSFGSVASAPRLAPEGEFADVSGVQTVSNTGQIAGDQ